MRYSRPAHFPNKIYTKNHRLFHVKHRDDTSGDPNSLKRGRQDIGLNRTSTMQAEERARLAKDKKGSRKGDSSSHDITADMKLQTNMNLQILDQS